MQPYSAIIFDFNGVLLWDTALQVAAWQATAQGLRGQALSDEEFAIHVHGRSGAHTLAYLLGQPVQGNRLNELIQAKESHYRTLCLANPAIFVLSPGAEALLDFLATQHIPMTIATASERTNLDFFITHLNLAKWFDLDRIVYDDGFLPGKPAPDMYQRAAAKLGIAPCGCIVVEDAISGLQAAHAAGIGHIVALGPLATHARLVTCEGVSAVIENLAQIPHGWLQGAPIR
jgi:beta-phosphoglucomutase-like phosphatase (HAD superfamily)